MKKFLIILIVIVLILAGAYLYWKKQKAEGPSGDTTIAVTDAVVDEVILTAGTSYPLTLTVTAKGNLPDGCTAIKEMTHKIEGNTFLVKVTQSRDTTKMCAQVLVPYEHSVNIPIDGLPLGQYVVDVNGVKKDYLLEVGPKL